ncbi:MULTISPECIES: fumarylacetoacetase [unclassified Nocardioides]|uniref:fumarylacetoacetase n=1 Tax=unclassified Nocardioides TaxID=2615069 RepID=UPI0009F15092|nr:MULTISPECIES: fumarylacetoacetase [unclassified Nocardioides]GAW48908.1 fumarylacetoacetase [Nocardioides sp. PD653-B2]GAW54545.1 fumarylacetoacetase [Nocardioides sp. PD653]
MTTWVDGAEGSLFDVDNLPYGVFSLAGEEPRVGVRIGELVLDLAPVAAAEMLDAHHVFQERSLNALMAEGRLVRESVRRWITGLLTDETERDLVEPHLVPVADVTLHLPVEVADYVDFYASLDHASNVGRIFRPDQEPLLPNWRHLPVGYHGRAGTVVASGTPVTRPSGQHRGDDGPTYGPSTRLDIEAELGFVVGTPSELGSPVAYGAFADHVFGVVGLNDWSARDIQAWEYVPLGPFLGKSFATSISAWVTPLEALDAAWVDLPGQDPTPLPYLGPGDVQGLDIDVEVLLNGTVVSRPPYRTMYWSPAQMLAHITVNGASLRTGDLYASGTISGPERDQRGSFLELSWGGTEPFGAELWGDGRTFLEDGDEVVLRYTAPGTAGGRIALGEVSGVVEPARV